MFESFAWAASKDGGIGNVISSLIEWIIIFAIIYYVIKWWRRKKAKEEKQINNTTYPPEKWPEMCQKLASRMQELFDIWFTKCIEILRDHGIQPVNSNIYTPEGLPTQAKAFGFQILIAHIFVIERNYVERKSVGDFILTLCDEFSKINNTWKEGVNYYYKTCTPIYKIATSDELVDFLQKAAQEPAKSIAHYLTFDETRSDAIELIQSMMPAFVLFTQIAVATSFLDTDTVTELMAKISG